MSDSVRSFCSNAGLRSGFIQNAFKIALGLPAEGCDQRKIDHAGNDHIDIRDLDSLLLRFALQ